MVHFFLFAHSFNFEQSYAQRVKLSIRSWWGGYSKASKLTQAIRQDIKTKIAAQRCIILGTHRSSDHKTEVDHKDGRKDDLSIMNPKTQRLEDFQPLSKPANDAKRQFCKECKASGNRYDAKLLGYTIAVTTGKIKYEDSVGCKGCYWFDPKAFNQSLILKQ